jgi:hypothetical protein
LNFSYNVHAVWKGYEMPLHPGAARYYKEQGYLKCHTLFYAFQTKPLTPPRELPK